MISLRKYFILKKLIISMVFVDDIGSFPLPDAISMAEFAKLYLTAREVVAKGADLRDNPSLLEGFYKPVASSLKCKIDSGIDVVNYPQHYDMHRQFLEPIHEHAAEPFVVEEKYAVIPELFVVKEEAKRYYEKTGERLGLKVCVTGPIELYTRTEFGYHVYIEILENLAKSVNHFLKKAVLDRKYIVTKIVSIDEPSLGIVDFLNVEHDDLTRALEKSVRGVDATVQIHLHGLAESDIPLAAAGIDVLTAETAASPQNLRLILKKELDENDKFLRVGITRTNIDTIIGEWLEKGIQPQPGQLVDEIKTIKGRYEEAQKLFGDRLAFVGPDCGLGAWPSQEVAQLLLKRTVEAVKG